MQARDPRILTAAGVLGVAAAAAWWTARRRRGGAEVGASRIVARPPRQVWQRWRRLEDLPRFLEHVESVEPIDDVRSRWTAVTAGGQRLEWVAEIVEETPGRRLAWCSLPGGDLDHRGELEVLPVTGRPGDGEASIVRASIRVDSGRGFAGRLAQLPALTGRALGEDLRRFRSLVEAGEVPRTDGQPTGDRPAIDPSNPF